MENRSEDSLYYLNLVSPRIYLNNVFRVANINVDISLRDAKKIIKDKENSKKLGIMTKNIKKRFFPIQQGQSFEDMRMAVDQRLANPYARLIEELFWFWSDNFDNDVALNYLQEGFPGKARDEWLHNFQRSQDNHIALHNLAIIYHLQALDQEFQIQEGGVNSIVCTECNEYFYAKSPALDSKCNCPNCGRMITISTPAPQLIEISNLSNLWRDALQFWRRLWMNAAFWSEFAIKAKTIDSILENEIEKVRQNLFESILSINITLAYQYEARGESGHAERHAHLIQSSNFAEKSQIRAIQINNDKIADQIHQHVSVVEKKIETNPSSGLKEITGLIEKTRSDIKCIEMINTVNSSKNGYPAFDAVASICLRGIIQYVNSTHNSESTPKALEYALQIVKSEVLKNKIVDSLRILEKNIEAERVNSNIAELNSLCEDIFEELEKVDKQNAGKSYTLYNRYQEKIAPLLNNIRDKYGNDSREYIQAANTCALCLRNLSIVFNNINDDIGWAIEAIKKAVDICRDDELGRKLNEGLQICQNNKKIKRKNYYQQHSEAINGVIGIGIVIIIGIIISIVDSGKEKSSYSVQYPGTSSYSNSPTSSNLSNSYTLSLKKEIEGQRVSINVMKAQLDDLDAKFENMKRKMESFRMLEQYEDYNLLVPVVNSLANQYNELLAKYKSAINDINMKIERYNAYR